MKFFTNDYGTPCHDKGTSFGEAVFDTSITATTSITSGTTVTVGTNLICALDRLANNTITDPGSAAAIPVTASGICEIVTGGSGETNTLAVPTFAGQVLVLNLITDGGGDRVITVADPHIDGTNNTITLNDAGDIVVLIAKKTAATPTYGWALLLNLGATLSHV